MATWGRPLSLHTRPERRQDDGIRRQYLWNNPDGNQPDFSETFTYGEDILVSWNALNNSMYDLWLTSWNYDPNSVALCLARAVNLAHDGNLKLITPDPPSAQLANQTRYVLRFKPPTGEGEFVASDPDLSSPGFFLVNPSISRQAVSSTTASTTATASSTNSLVIPSRGVATPSAVPEESGPNLSPLKAAGLTIGLILAVVCLVAMEVAYLTWRRRKRRREALAGEGDEGAGGGGRYERRREFGKGESGPLVVQVDKVEMPSDMPPWMSPELPGDSTWGRERVPELHGGGPGSRPGGIRVVGEHDAQRGNTLNSSLVELDAARG